MMRRGGEPQRSGSRLIFLYPRSRFWRVTRDEIMTSIFLAVAHNFMAHTVIEPNLEFRESVKLGYLQYQGTKCNTRNGTQF